MIFKNISYFLGTLKGKHFKLKYFHNAITFWSVIELLNIYVVPMSMVTWGVRHTNWLSFFVVTKNKLQFSKQLLNLSTQEAEAEVLRIQVEPLIARSCHKTKSKFKATLIICNKVLQGMNLRNIYIST
jgi:hypothetical protein